MAIYQQFPGCRSGHFVFRNCGYYDRREVNDISYTRRALTFLCLAVILSAAVAHAGVNLLLAILVPIWFFLATVLFVLLPSVDERHDIEPSPFLPVLSPRPPPAR